MEILKFIVNRKWRAFESSGAKIELKLIPSLCYILFFPVHRLSDATTENAKLMSQPICLEGKFDLRVSSTFGTPSGILLHVEKNPGNKSLSRRRKD